MSRRVGHRGQREAREGPEHGECGCGRCPLYLRGHAGVAEGSPEVTGGLSSGLLGSCWAGTWARVFGNKETDPDLHHGKSELRAKSGVEDGQLDGRALVRGPRGAGLQGSVPDGAAQVPPRRAGSSWACGLGGSGEGEPPAREGQARIPQCVPPRSPAWRLLWPPVLPPTRLPPPGPSAARRCPRRCREPFIR